MYDLHCHLIPGLDDGAQTAAEALSLLQLAQHNGISHIVMTPHINPGYFDNTSAMIYQGLRDLKQLAKVSALALRKIMGKIVLEIIEQEKISEIFIEGGSTAAEILQQLKIDDFIPVNQLTRGVIRLKETNKELYITVKPGSYQLPKQISKLYLSSSL